MKNLTRQQKDLIVYLIVLVAVMMAFSLTYIVHLMYQSGQLAKQNERPGVDVYDILLDDKLGIHTDDYADRPLYSEELYDSDRSYVLKCIADRRFDLIADLASGRLSEYQFGNDHLATLLALSNADMAWQAEGEERVQAISNIRDPEIFVKMLLLLSPEEQGMLLGEQQLIPGYPYQEVVVLSDLIAEKSSPVYARIGDAPYTVAKLVFHDKTTCIYMTRANGLKIFLVELD